MWIKKLIIWAAALLLALSLGVGSVHADESGCHKSGGGTKTVKKG